MDTQVSHYGTIADYYDQLMNAGYYDHSALGEKLLSITGTGKSLLELGIGTGLMARELLNQDPSVELTGIDFSESMLTIARKRIPEGADLVECDVAEMRLNKTFDVAYSTGGTWVIINSEKGLSLGTHLYDRENDIKGIKQVAKHLQPGGLLLLSVHPPHEDRSFDIGNGLQYSQEIKGHSGFGDHYSLLKTYRFSRGEETLAEEQVVLGFYEESLYLPMFLEAELEPVGMTANNDFFMFKKAD